VAWLTGGLTTAFVAGLALMVSDLNAFAETVLLGSTGLMVLLAVNLVVAATTAGMVVGAGAAWIRG
jgi:hypothetical protein